MKLWGEIVSILAALATIFFLVPSNLQTVFIVVVIFSVIIYYLFEKEIHRALKKLDRYKDYHRKKITFLLVTIILIFSIFELGHYLIDTYYPPEPPEDKLVVAISPFYVNTPNEEHYSVQTAEEFKARIEKEDLGIYAILLNSEPIRNKKDAEFYGKKAGAHIVVYGEVNSATGNRQEIVYQILPLASLDIKQKIENDTYFQEKLSEEIMYHSTHDDTITIIQTLEENASSVVNTIAAFENYQHSQFQLAIKLFESIKGYREDGVILFFIGSCYYFEGNYSESLQYFEKAIEIDPQDLVSWNNKGAALSKLGKYEEAIQAYDKAIEINPQIAGYWLNKGNALCELGKYEEAIQAYDKAIEINPQDADVWYNKGLSLSESGKNEEAIQTYDKAIEINPNLFLAWQNKGVSLSELGKYEEAIQAYDKAIEINPQIANVWYNKGNALFQLGKYEESIQAYDKAIEINPDLLFALVNKGAALSRLGKYEEAIKAYDKAIEIEPNDATVWYGKGNVLMKLGREEEASLCYEKAEELSA